MPLKLRSWIEKNEALILILLLASALRIPSLFEPYWYGDEGIYLTLGQALRKGLVWYRDIHDNKPPLLYLIAGAANNVFYFRLILLFWFNANLVVFYRLMQFFIPQAKKAWIIASLLLILLTTLVEGNVANAEIFMALPITIAIFLALKQSSALLIGFLFSLAFLFKVPAGFDLAAVLGWWLLFEPNKLKNVVLSLIGFLTPIGATITYYAVRGGLEPYVRSALMQNIGYLSSWQGSQSGLIGRLGITAGFLAIFSLISHKIKLANRYKLILFWFLLSLFGALLSARPYPHYLIQPAFPAAILITLLLFQSSKVFKILIISLIGLTVSWYCQIKFWSYPVISYYQNFLAYVSGQKTVAEYRNWFDPSLAELYRLAGQIKSTTLPEDKIFIWGDLPTVYALSQRLPVGRYTAAYHIIDFNGFKQTLDFWDKTPPKIVLTLNNFPRRFEAMEARLNSDYILKETRANIRIYYRLELK